MAFVKDIFDKYIELPDGSHMDAVDSSGATGNTASVRGLILGAKFDPGGSHSVENATEWANAIIEAGLPVDTLEDLDASIEEAKRQGIIPDDAS